MHKRAYLHYVYIVSVLIKKHIAIIDRIKRPTIDRSNVFNESTPESFETLFPHALIFNSTICGLWHRANSLLRIF